MRRSANSLRTRSPAALPLDLAGYSTARTASSRAVRERHLGREPRARRPRHCRRCCGEQAGGLTRLGSGLRGSAGVPRVCRPSAPGVVESAAGCVAALAQLLQRLVAASWSGLYRSPMRGAKRLAGGMASTRPGTRDDGGVPEPARADLLAELRRLATLKPSGTFASGDFVSGSAISLDTLRRPFGNPPRSSAPFRHAFDRVRPSHPTRGNYVADRI